MEYVKLDRKAVTSWRIGRAIGLAAALFVCAALWIGSRFLLEGETYQSYQWAVTLVLVLFLIYKLIGLILYPLIEYRQWGYLITEDKVDLRHGIFFITRTIIPVIRLQHITVSQGPINRRLGLYQVEMSLASGSFTIECLSKEAADAIAENLKAKLYVRLENRDEAQLLKKENIREDEG